MTKNELFTPEQIDEMRKAYSTLETVSVEHLPKFHKMFAAMTERQLKQTALAGIKFVSSLARNACVRRKISLQ